MGMKQSKKELVKAERFWSTLTLSLADFNWKKWHGVIRKWNEYKMDCAKNVQTMKWAQNETSKNEVSQNWNELIDWPQKMDCAENGKSLFVSSVHVGGMPIAW